MSAVAIDEEVIEHYCLHVCKMPQNQCLTFCNLRRVAEINYHRATGMGLKEATQTVVRAGKRELKTINLQEIGAAGVWSCDVVLPNLRGMFDLWDGATSIPVQDGASIVNIIAGGGLPEITVYMVCKVSEGVAA